MTKPKGLLKEKIFGIKDKRIMTYFDTKDFKEAQNQDMYNCDNYILIDSQDLEFIKKRFKDKKGELK